MSRIRAGRSVCMDGLVTQRGISARRSAHRASGRAASELTPPNAKPRAALTTPSYHEGLGESSAILLNPIQETVAAT